MEKRNAPLEVAQSSDLAVEMKRNSESDSSCGTSKEANEFSMPIYFLVKEQAKSLIAIQELQKRMNVIENVQEDVIDSLAEIRIFLCNDTKSFSGLNSASTPNSVIKSSSFNLKSPFIKSRRFSYSPSVLQATLEVPQSVLKSKSNPQKDCDHEYKTQSAATGVNEHSQKIFDLSKTKDSALESDKQDSGLDSDCREQNDAHPSLNKHSLNWIKQESNDELLQLLDEISQRSEILQKQLAVVEENAVDQKPEMSTLYPNHHDIHEHSKSITGNKSRFSFSEGTSHLEKRGLQRKLYTHPFMDHDTDAEENVPIILESKISNSPEYFEGKSLGNNLTKMKRRAANKIDSAMVSSILKETNVVDLQRQVLIYLVENAVLQTKLLEVEHMLSSKTTESEKIENSLKDETRLLMMENRELRISLDEQKLEVNALKSKVGMLERVLQSVTVENRELNWQLGESLGLQNLSRRESRNFSTSFTFGNSSNNSKPFRKSSLPHQISGQNEMNINCVKSKLLSNRSSFLDDSVEESNHCLPPSAVGAFKCQPESLQTSTPLLPFKRQKDIVLSNSSAAVSSSNRSPANFHTIKKQLKSNSSIEKENAVSKSHRSEKCLAENNFSEVYGKGMKITAENAEGATSKFPFNTILEKLKSNSDYKLSKRFPVTQDEVPDSSTVEQVKLLSCKSKTTASQARDSISHNRDTQSQVNNLNPSCENSQDNNFHARKGRNIHQRIQDILDRIMAESEDAT